MQWGLLSGHSKHQHETMWLLQRALYLWPWGFGVCTGLELCECPGLLWLLPVIQRHDKVCKWRQKEAQSFLHTSWTFRSCYRPFPSRLLLPDGSVWNHQFIMGPLQSIKHRRTKCCSDSSSYILQLPCTQRNRHTRCTIDMFFCQRSQTTHLILWVCVCV